MSSRHPTKAACKSRKPLGSLGRHRPHRPHRLVGLFLLTLCAGVGYSAAATADNLTVTQGADRAVNTFVSNEWGFSTSSYWIEGPKGVVVIDTQFLPSAGLATVQRAEKATGKKVVLAIVLHPNPDKFNGTAALQKRGIKVITSAQVAAAIPSVHKKRVGWFYDRYKPDYPRETPKPDVFGARSQTLKVAGLTLGLHVLGKGCSAAHVAVTYKQHLFVGDLVSNNNHAWLELGDIGAWQKRLTELRKLPDIKRVHPGRGPSAGPELLVAQQSYLRYVTKMVKNAKPKGEISDKKGEISDKTLDRLIDTMKARYPAHDFVIFLRIGLPAVWKRLGQ